MGHCSTAGLAPLASNIKCAALPAVSFLHPILPTTVVAAVVKAVAHANKNISISAQSLNSSRHTSDEGVVIVLLPPVSSLPNCNVAFEPFDADCGY